MNHRFAFIGGISAALLSASVLAADSYLCVADQATGFSFNKASSRWEITKFNVNSKYLISKSKEKGYRWEVKEVGQNVPFARCEKDFNNKYGGLICEGLPEIRVNKISGRFLSIYPMGYWTDGRDGNKWFQEGDNTPFMEIGKCSSL